MKKIVGIDNFGSYYFNPLTKTIEIFKISNLKLEQILLITDVTNNVIIYNFADNNFGGTLVNNILTLNYNTTSFSNSDKLQIIIEVNENDTVVSEGNINYLRSKDDNSIILLENILKEIKYLNLMMQKITDFDLKILDLGE